MQNLRPLLSIAFLAVASIFTARKRFWCWVVGHRTDGFFRPYEGPILDYWCSRCGRWVTMSDLSEKLDPAVHVSSGPNKARATYAQLKRHRGFEQTDLEQIQGIVRIRDVFDGGTSYWRRVAGQSTTSEKALYEFDRKEPKR